MTDVEREPVAWIGELQAESGNWITQRIGPFWTKKRAEAWTHRMGWPPQHIRIVPLYRHQPTDDPR